MTLPLDELLQMPREDRLRYYTLRAAAGLPLWGRGRPRQTPVRTTCVACGRHVPHIEDRVSVSVPTAGRTVTLCQCLPCCTRWGWGWLLPVGEPTPSAGRLRT